MKTWRVVDNILVIEMDWIFNWYFPLQESKQYQWVWFQMVILFFFTLYPYHILIWKKYVLLYLKVTDALQYLSMHETFPSKSHVRNTCYKLVNVFYWYLDLLLGASRKTMIALSWFKKNAKPLTVFLVVMELPRFKSLFLLEE